jgi:hypothetical protein
VGAIDEEARMALARVVKFEGVGKERVEQLEREVQEGGKPEGLPATELIVLHDPADEKSLVIVFVENEDDYARADEILSSMPADETPGRRTSVKKYDVVVRMTD